MRAPRAPHAGIETGVHSHGGGALPHRATQNLRRHAWRAVRRIVALLAVDAAGFVIARALMRAVGNAPFDHVDGLIALWSAHMHPNELALATAFVIGTTVSGSYGPGDVPRQPRRLFVAAAIASALPLWSALWSQPTAGLVWVALLTFAPLFLVLVALRSAFAATAEHWAHRSRAGTLARTVLIGSAADCRNRMQGESLSRRAGFDVLGFIDIAPRPHRGALGAVEDVERILWEHDADTLVLCGLPTASTTSRVLRAAAVAECTVLALAPQLELPAVRPNVITQGGQPLLELRPVALRAEHLLMKRALDVIGALVGLVVLAPVFAIVAVAVMLDSPGPVIFRQRRLGRFGRPIDCYKFRSMYVDAEAQLLADPVLFRRYVEHDYKLPAAMDTRITPIGHILRRASLDELPQLWNVLKGDMSLVGPRPIVPDEIHHYNGEGPLLLSLKPGITGAWQVSGRSSLPYPRRASIELEYVEGWSLWRDLAILLRTIPAVIVARGAH